MYKNLNLDKHVKRVIENFKENPQNFEDSLPTKSYIDDNGEGEETWYLDVPNIEESYSYTNEKDRDSDYDKLMQEINLLRPTKVKAAFDIVEQEILRGMEGKNSSLPMGFPRMNKYVSIRKKIYTLVFGGTGTGKTAFVHNAYILNPFDWWYAHRKTSSIKLKVFLFSMERGKLYTLAKWLSRKIFMEEGKLIPIAKMLGWWENSRLTADEHDLTQQYGDYINELCEVVDIREGAQNPTEFYKTLKNYALSHGREEDVDEHHKIYIPDDENEIVIPIVDHMGLTKLERGMSKKEAIDKGSEYFQWSRDYLGYAPVVVSQITRDASNPMYMKLDSFEPNLDQVKESGRPAEDADCVLSLFQPTRYKTNDPSYNVANFIDQDTGGDYFRKIKILKNSYGEADIGFGMAFHGAIGEFKELPRKKDMEGFNYESLFNHKYFLQR